MRSLSAFVLLVALIGLTACGGSGSGSSDVTGAAPNVVPIVVNAGPANNALNVVYTTITVCIPNTQTCANIDNVQVDTGSYGVRILASALGSLALPKETDPASGNPLAECVQFGDGYSWGSLRTADFTVAEETAPGIPVQVIGDLASSTVPADCSSTAPVNNAEDTVATFGANGILGIGTQQLDCGNICATEVVPATYYVCPSGAACTGIAVNTDQQVINPIVKFPTDSNGSIIELPSVAAGGAASVTGSLVFGIDTESNNALGSASVLTVNSNNTYFPSITALFDGQTLTDSFLDSGSNGLFFNDPIITQCTGGSSGAGSFYCPSSTTNITATLKGQDSSGASISSPAPVVNLTVANAETLFSNNTLTAFSNIGGTNADPQSFDFGLPFFYGRNVYTAIEGENTSGGVGPFYAF